MTTLSQALFTAGPVVEVGLDNSGEVRFFIVAGQPGFNCRANNARGFASKAAALAAIAKFSKAR